MNEIDKNNIDIKILSEKITNTNMQYDIDEDFNINNNSPKLDEKIKNDDEILDFKEPSSLNTETQKENIQTKKILIPKLSSIKLVKCKIHNKEYLKLIQNNFEVVCEKCIEEGNESQLEIINRTESEEEEENNYNCYIHQESKGSFYCDECKKFICKMCFAEEHRTHKCHLPEIIIKEFVKNVQESIDYSNELSPILNENINNIKKIYETLKQQKSDIMKVPQNTLKIISNNNSNQIDLLLDKSFEKFQGIDNEIHDDYITHNILKEKTNEYLEIIKNIINDINNIDEKDKTKFDLCKYHKEKTSLLKEIYNYINTSFNFINIRLNNTNNKYDQNKEKIENSINLMNKEILNYEKSCISSISTGRENRAIILRRYIHFSHNEIKYFKNSIISFASNDYVFLSGLSLCGLYIKKKKNQIQTNNNSDNNETNNIETNDNNDTEINEEMSKKILIQITISTMINQVEGEKLFVQKCELTGVKGSEEPSIIINFEKGIKISKEKLYLIKIENLSDNNYIDIWTGSVGKIKKKNIQVIRCHNTGIQFLFKQAEGIQTDFDEFENGIIEGVLYSTNK